MSTEKKLSEQMSRELKKHSAKCNSTQKYIDLVFSFKFKNYSISPIQIKNEIHKLVEILSEEKPKTLLEIGTANGGTLFLLCKIASATAKILSIDLPGGNFGGELYPDWKMQVYQTFAKRNQRLHLIRSDSHKIETYKKTEKLLGKNKLDFLLIDGDHTFKGVKQDFSMYRKLVTRGGIIAFHDIKPGPKNEVGGVPNFWRKINSQYPSLEIIEDDGRTGSYGIGLVFLEPIKAISSSYTRAMKSLIRFQDTIIKKKENKLHKANLTVQAKDKKLKQHDQMILEKNRQLQDKENKLHKANLTVQEKDKKLEQHDQMILEKNQQLQDKENQLHKANQVVQEKENQLHKANQVVQEKDQKLQKSLTDLEEIQTEFQQKEQKIKQLEVLMSESNRIKKENDSLIVQYQNELDSIKNSKTWKTLQRYVRVKKILTGRP